MELTLKNRLISGIEEMLEMLGPYLRMLALLILWGIIIVVMVIIVGMLLLKAFSKEKNFQSLDRICFNLTSDKILFSNHKTNDKSE